MRAKQDLVLGKHAGERSTVKLPWSREREADQVARCVAAATGHRSAADADEADVYRLAAQLLATRFPREALTLETVASEFYPSTTSPRRSFPQIVEDDLVMDIPRLRNLLEQALTGVHSW